MIAYRQPQQLSLRELISNSNPPTCSFVPPIPKGFHTMSDHSYPFDCHQTPSHHPSPTFRFNSTPQPPTVGLTWVPSETPPDTPRHPHPAITPSAPTSPAHRRRHHLPARFKRRCCWLQHTQCPLRIAAPLSRLTSSTRRKIFGCQRRARHGAWTGALSRRMFVVQGCAT